MLENINIEQIITTSAITYFSSSVLGNPIYILLFLFVISYYKYSKYYFVDLKQKWKKYFKNDALYVILAGSPLYERITDYIIENHRDKNFEINKYEDYFSQKIIVSIIGSFNFKYNGKNIMFTSETEKLLNHQSKLRKYELVSNNFQNIDYFLKSLKNKKNHLLIYDSNKVKNRNGIRDSIEKIIWESKFEPFNESSLECQFYNDSVMKNFFEEMDSFLNNKNNFNSISITRKKNFLLHGPPGCGKTSAIKICAYTHSIPIYNIDSGRFTLKEILQAIKSIDTKDPHILLFEDFDRFFNNSDKDVNHLSSIFNILDGINSSHNRMIIITTNHLEKLMKIDGLLRAGRIDKKIHFTEYDKNMVIKTIEYHYPEFKNEFNDVDIKNISPANLMNIIISCYDFNKDDKFNYLKTNLIIEHDNDSLDISDLLLEKSNDNKDKKNDIKEIVSFSGGDSSRHFQALFE